METIDKLANVAEEFAGEISHAAHQTAQAVGEKSGQLIDMEQKAMKNCRASIRDYPIASVGIALAAGFVLARLTRSCSPRKK